MVAGTVAHRRLKWPLRRTPPASVRAAFAFSKCGILPLKVEASFFVPSPRLPRPGCQPPRRTEYGLLFLSSAHLRNPNPPPPNCDPSTRPALKLFLAIPVRTFQNHNEPLAEPAAFPFRFLRCMNGASIHRGFFFGSFFKAWSGLPLFCKNPSCMFDAPATGGHAVNNEFSGAQRGIPSRNKIL